tara:strand:+ start:459 stop:869 length:411 start_codon:yes stop_codon:yes gene_type:complete
MSDNGDGTQLQSFTIDQAAGAFALALGALGSLLLVVWQSRCLCKCRVGLSDECYIFDCSREPPVTEEEESKDKDSKNNKDSKNKKNSKKDKDKDPNKDLESLIPPKPISMIIEEEPEEHPVFSPKDEKKKKFKNKN